MQEKTRRSTTQLLLSSFLDTDRKSIAAAIAASIISGVTSALLIAFIGKQFTDIHSFNYIGVLQFLGLLIASLFFNLYAGHALIRASSLHNYRLRMTLCRRILGTDFQSLEKVGNHRLKAALSEDMENVAMAYTNMPDMVINFTRIFFCIIYLVWIAPFVMSALLVFSIPVFYVQAVLFRNSKRHMRALFPIRDNRYSLYEQLTDGFKELLVNRFWRNGFYQNHLKVNAKEYMYAQRRMFMASRYALQWGQSAYFIIILVILILSQKGYASQDQVAIFALMGLFIRTGLNSVMGGVMTWQRAGTSLEKIDNLGLNADSLNLKDDTNCKDSNLHSASGRPAAHTLTLQNLSFSYSSNNASGKPSLGPVNISFRSGELVFITGGNGSGKTTLVKLITGLYKPKNGKILLNDKELSIDNSEWYLHHFYPLFSDFNVSDEFLETTIAVAGEPDPASLDRLKLPFKPPYDNREAGAAKLSSGQTARLALFPMLALNRPIVIFDEWAAHQDPEFKDMFYNDLLQELKDAGKLVIVITHDDRYFGLADRLIKLESGRIVEPG